MYYYLQTVLLLTLVYLGFTSNFELSNIVTGILIAVGVTALIRPNWREAESFRLGTAVIALLKYVVILAWDLLVSGVQVARMVLSPKLSLNQGIIAIPSGCESELGTALSAHAITLTPGEMVVEIDENGVMYTHSLDVSEAEADVAAAQQKRVELLDKIFP